MFSLDQPLTTTYTEPHLSRQTCVWDLHRGEPEATQRLHRARQNLSSELKRACLGAILIYTYTTYINTDPHRSCTAGWNAVFHTKSYNRLPPCELDIIHWVGTSVGQRGDSSNWVVSDNAHPTSARRDSLVVHYAGHRHRLPCIAGVHSWGKLLYWTFIRITGTRMYTRVRRPGC
jgi:hypothetical protein